MSHITILHPGMHFIGGAERLMADLTIELAREGVSVDFVAGFFHDFWRSYLSGMRRVNLKSIGKKIPGNASSWLNLKKNVKLLLKAISPRTDVILASSFPSNLSAQEFARQHDVMVACYLHEAPMVLHDKQGLREIPLQFRIVYQVLSAFFAADDIKAVRASDIIITNSQFSRRVNAEIYGVNISRIKVVYPGVNTNKIKPFYIPPKQICKYVTSGVPIILAPGGAKIWGNREILLQSIRKLKVERFIAVFTGGSHNDGAALLKTSRKLGIEEKIRWVGILPNNELNSMYTFSSAVISIPKRQPFGLTALEALACGSPPIISRFGGIAEVLRNGIEAVCVDHNDPSQVADALEKLILDEETREKMVINGRRRIMSDLNIERFAGEIKSILNI